MAHKKGEGSTQNGRDSNPKRLGVKLFGGQTATAGNIIIRQRGSKFHLGENVYMGKDWTIHAQVDGRVTYKKGRRNRTYVHVIPFEEVQETIAKPAPKVKPPKEVKADKVEVPVATTMKAAEPAKEEKKETKAAAAPKAAPSKKDNLKIVEGIGPKIESLLNDAGILTFAQLAATEASKIKEILVAAGSRYGFHDPTTWPQQAGMAAEGKMDELKAWQDELQGGKVEAKSEEE